MKPSTGPDNAFLQERYQLLVESVEDYAIFTLSAAGIIETWNKGAERIKGYRAHEIIGQHFSKFYPAEDIAARKPDYELEVAAEVGRFEDEGWRVRNDGSLFWANVIITALRDPEDGHLRGYAKVTRDLTERKAHEDSLRASRESLSATLHSIGDAVITTDEHGLVTRLNPVAEQLTGWSRQDAEGRPLAEVFKIVNEDTQLPVESPVVRVLREGLIVGLANHTALIAKNGNTCPISDSGAPIRDAAGKLRGAVMVFRDVTEQRKAEENLRKSEERFRLLVSQVRDYAIFMLDPTGCIISWNAGAEHLKGYQAEEIIGQHFSRFYPPQDIASDKPGRELEEAIANGRLEDEGWRVRKDGTLFWANVVITALRDDSGVLIGFAKVTRDLTERRQAALKLLEEQVARAQSESAQKRSSFLAHLSKTLAEASDARSAMARIAKAVLPTMGDYCIVDLRAADGTVESLSVAHIDPTKEELVWSLRRLQSPEASDGHPVPTVRRTRRSDLVHTITNEMLVAGSKTPAYLEVLRKLHPTSYMVVPMVLGEAAIGTISFVSTSDERHFDETDLALAEDLAHRAALVIEHARLYEAEQHARVAAEESRSQLENVLEQLPAGVILAEAPSGRLVMANQEAQRILGHPLEPGASMKEFPVELYDGTGAQYQPSDRPLSRAISHGNIIHNDEAKIVRQDGTSSWVSVNAAPIKGISGNDVAGVVTFHDVTDRKRTAEMVGLLANAGAILGSSLEYETTLQQLATLVVPSLADWCMVHVPDGKGGIPAVGVAHADPEKMKWAHALGEHYAPRHDDPHGVADVLRTGRSVFYAHISEEMRRGNTPDEEYVHIMNELGMTSVIIVPLAVHGLTVGTLTMVSAESKRTFDENDLAFAEELGRRAAVAVENARLYRESVHAVRLRDEFVSIASHELKTPLTSLQLHVDGLLQYAERGVAVSPERNLAKLTAVAEQVERQERLINDLLDFSRIAAGRLALQLERFDLRQLIAAVGERFEEQLAKQKCVLTIDAPSPVMGHWDWFRLDQVVTNLLSNALKYAAGLPIEIRVSATESAAELVVIDHGPGIAAKDQERVFDRFERAVSGRNYGGFGLGLWIVREIVSRMGGEVSVASEAGQGAAFKVKLPLESNGGDGSPGTTQANGRKAS